MSEQKLVIEVRMFKRCLFRSVGTVVVDGKS
jgi:hypothetical protein